MHPRWFGATDLIDRVRWQLGVEGAIRAPVDAVRLIPEVTESLGDHADSLFGGGPDEVGTEKTAALQEAFQSEEVEAFYRDFYGDWAPLPWDEDPREQLDQWWVE